MSERHAYRRRLDATVIEGIRQRWQHDPQRAGYEVRRYLERVRAYRQKLDAQPPAARAPAAKRLNAQGRRVW